MKETIAVVLIFLFCLTVALSMKGKNNAPTCPTCNAFMFQGASSGKWFCERCDNTSAKEEQ